MDETELQSIREACRHLVAALTHHGDRQQHEETAALFAETGVWARGGKEVTGRAAILAELQAQPPQAARHYAANTLVTVRDADHAEAVTDFVFYRHAGAETDAPYPFPAPFSAGEWRDSFVRTAEGWRFARREMGRFFKAA